MSAGAGLKICPFCKEQIREEAVKCRFCGEWFEEVAARTTESESNAEPAESADVASRSGAPGSTIATDQQTDGAPSAATAPVPVGEVEEIGKSSRQNNPPKDYWYGYLYMLFCGYLTYCAVTHLLVTAMKPAPVGDLQAQTEYWMSLVLWTGATAFFAYVTYRLSQGRVKMGLIYTVVTLHGINVLFRGIRPGELLIWVVLSGVVVTKFREQKRLEGENAADTSGYELLERATRLETKGRVQEALAAYQQVAENYSHTAAGQDAEKSLKSLRAKISQ